MTAFEEVATAVVAQGAPDKAQRLADMLLFVAAAPDNHAWHDRMTEMALLVERIEVQAGGGG